MNGNEDNLLVENIDKRLREGVENILSPSKKRKDSDNSYEVERSLRVVNDNVNKILESYDVCVPAILKNANNEEVDFGNVNEEKVETIYEENKDVTLNNEDVDNTENSNIINKENDEELPDGKLSLKRKGKKRKHEEVKSKHPLLDSCFCKMKACHNKLDESARERIHDKFWELNYNGQRLWIYNHIQ